MPTIIDEPIDETLTGLLEGADGPLYAVGPSETVIEELVDVGTGLDDPPEIRLLAAESTLKTVVDDFLVAGHAADLVAEGTLLLRTVESPPGNDFVVSEEDVSAVILAGSTSAALSTDDAGFVDDAHAFYHDAWEGAEEFSLRTPPLSRVRATLESDIGPDAEADFDAVLASLETARGDGDGLDEVTISLLVAAKNQELLYDISKWGEDVGIASKATFSRTKTELEDLGLLDTEKVPIDVGRPRLRLKFGNEKLQSASSDELASVAQSLIA
jgi:hypothetical protein